MVFQYYPRPEEDAPEPEEEQHQDSPSYLPFYLSYIYPAPPAPDPGYVAPGETHTLPSGPTTHPDPPIPNDVVAIVTPPPTISGPGYVMPSVALDPATETSPEDKSAAQAAEETSAQAVLPDIGVAQQSPIYSADIKFYLAAPRNSVLNEVRLMCQHESIPPALRDRPDLLLRLCAEYGMDEENDAEARAYLEYVTSTSEPTATSTATRQSTLTPLPTLDQTEIAHLLRTPEPAGTQIGHILQSFVVDDEAEGGTVDIELSDLEHANRSKLGLLSRDLNILGSTAPFQIQSPVVGPDVRVEIVSWEDKHDRNLGNFVLISFPASVFLENAQIMERLANDPNHYPSEWREGGRISIGFAHLSSIDRNNIYPGAILQDAGKATIGWTGNTAFHLDVSMAYIGRTKWNRHGFANAMDHMSKDRSEPNSYMAMVIRSNLFEGEGKGSVYAENIDIVWVWPQLDRLRNARTTKDAEGENESIYQQE